MQTRNEALAWIDALRGLAVTLVIASHAMPVLHGLPWAIKRFSNLGFFGVQLFFVVSCFTLARSWRGQSEARPPSLVGFALRRVFRIVPAYFLAALLYASILPHAPITVGRLATFLTFTGGFSPGQMPTQPGAWIGVPGGWSIEAEMMFYALFPLLMNRLRGVMPACAAALASLPLAWLANAAARSIYEPLYGTEAAEQFLYYWLPNQLPVFLIGLCVFEICTRATPGQPWSALGAWVGRHARAVLAGAAALFLALAWLPVPRLPEPGWAFIDAPALAAAAFGGAVLALRFGKFRWVALPALTRLGQASFSAYLLHFAIITGVEALLPPLATGLTGISACLASFAIFAAVLTITAGLSQVTYRWIEQPGIRLGGVVVRGWASGRKERLLFQKR